jgi:hypothetical protein
MDRWYGEFIAVVVCNRVWLFNLHQISVSLYQHWKSQRLTIGSVYRLCLTQ